MLSFLIATVALAEGSGVAELRAAKEDAILATETAETAETAEADEAEAIDAEAMASAESEAAEALA